MSSNPYPELRLAAGLIALSLSFAGCSSSASFERDDAVETAVPVEASSEEPLESEMTATEAAIARAGESQPSDTSVQEEGVALRPDAPMRYTVKRGDTLWDISSMFLKDPWLWPEIWYVNPQVQNPHLIYPGDVIVLAYGVDGRPQLRLERRGDVARMSPRLRSTPLEGAIPTIPYSAIASFLSRPTVLAAEDVKRAPRVLAFRDKHMIGGTGHEIYVRNLDAPENARYAVFHVGEPLRDPDDGDVIGYEGIYTATAVVTRSGNPAKAVLQDSARETLQGDRLFAADVEVPLNFELRAPSENVEGRIISVVDGVELIGQYQIVVINRGKRHGVDAGHVLAVDQAGEVVRDVHSSRLGFGSSLAPRVRLPSERAGTMLVFKSFDRVSYGLIVGATRPMRVADIVRNP